MDGGIRGDKVILWRYFATKSMIARNKVINHRYFA